MNSALFSSASPEWETPIELYNKLDAEFHFVVDPCCTTKNKKCIVGHCIDNGDNGLKRSWAGARSIFMNPPYGREIVKWVRKAYDEYRSVNGVIVGLLPARTDTAWFHKYIYHIAEIRFLRGRLHFSRSKHAAPFPSMIAIWRSHNDNKK